LVDREHESDGVASTLALEEEKIERSRPISWVRAKARGASTYPQNSRQMLRNGYQKVEYVYNEGRLWSEKFESDRIRTPGYRKNKNND
jgi:hypothetical protein